MSRRTIQFFTTADEIAFIAALPRAAFEAYAAIVTSGQRQYGEGVDIEGVRKAIRWRQEVCAASDELKRKEAATVERQAGEQRPELAVPGAHSPVGARPGRTPRSPADPAGRNEVCTDENLEAD